LPVFSRIIEGAAHGAGRGKEVIAVARSADAILIVLDAGKEQGNRHREILERELETVGIRLNQRPPDVTFTKRKSGGGIRFASTVPQPMLGPEPDKLVTQILRVCPFCILNSRIGVAASRRMCVPLTPLSSFPVAANPPGIQNYNCRCVGSRRDYSRSTGRCYSRKPTIQALPLSIQQD
jgi:hypothetical protein